MRNVLYLHGFASSPASAKIVALRPLLQPRGVRLHTPDLNVPSFEQLDLVAVVEHAVSIAREISPQVIVGSSLGAIIALEVAARGFDVPLVLIAPALGVAQRWKEKLPAGDPVVVYNFARGVDVAIHRHFFEQIDRVTVDEEPPSGQVIVVMGRGDETVPFDLVQKRWHAWQASGRLTEGSRFVAIDDGDHSLVSETGLIADEILGVIPADVHET